MRKFLTRIVDKSLRLLNQVKEWLKERDTKSPDAIQWQRTKEWYKDKDHTTLRFNYDLNESSIVVDLGGYDGTWTSDLYSMYNCSILIFEPYLPFAKNISNRFKHNA